MATWRARGAGVRHWHELLDHGSAIWRACRRRCVSDQSWRGLSTGHGLAYFRRSSAAQYLDFAADSLCRLGVIVLTA